MKEMEDRYEGNRSSSSGSESSKAPVLSLNPVWLRRWSSHQKVLLSVLGS